MALSGHDYTKRHALQPNATIPYSIQAFGNIPSTLRCYIKLDTIVHMWQSTCNSFQHPIEKRLSAFLSPGDPSTRRQ